MAWSADLERQICEDIESGMTLREVAKKNGVSKAVILKNVARIPSFGDQYARAISIRTDADFDALADEIRVAPEYTDKGVDPGWVQWRRLQIDTIKWALSKRCPKKYGDKIEAEINGDVGIKVTYVGASGDNVTK